MPPRMSAPDEAIDMTRGSRWLRAVAAALAITPEASAERAPLCTVGSTSTHTTLRSAVGRCRTSLVAAPLTWCWS